MINVSNVFVTINILSPDGYLPLSLGYIHEYNHVIFKRLLLWNRLNNFHQVTRFNMGPSVEGLLTISSGGSTPLYKMTAMPIYGKNT